MKTKTRTWSQHALLAVAALFSSSGIAESPSKPPAFVGDEDKLSGDHLLLRSTVRGFSDGSKTEKCALKYSKLAVVSEKDGSVTVVFYELSKRKDIEDAKDAKVWAAIESYCPEAERVNTATPYSITRAKLEEFGFRRTGVSFGGMVVPFKYRLGGDRKISASSTIAPYVGWRTALLQGYGVSFTPIFSAGLGLVPITDPTTNQTETKTAFSIATGLVMTSSKNQKFNAGLVIGRDYLSNADRERDPNVDKVWLSFYVGLAF